MNVNPNRCRYCQNFFCCEAHRIDHEVKHHKKPNLPLWQKNRNFAIQILANKNINNIKNKQQYSNKIKEYGTTEGKEAKEKSLSRKRPHSCITENEKKVSPAVFLESMALLERKILKPRYKNVKIFYSKNNLNVLKKDLNDTVQTDNAVTKSHEEIDLSCVIINKKPEAVNKKHDSPDGSEQKVINETKNDNSLGNSVTNETYKVSLASCASNKSQQGIIEEVLTQLSFETNVVVQRFLHTESYYEVTKQNIYNGKIESPPIDIKKEASTIIVSPVSDGGSPLGKTSTPVTGDQEDISLKMNDNWCTALQNSSLSMYKTPVEQYAETVAGSLMSPKETEGKQIKNTPAVTPLRGIMKNSKYNSPGNETLNSTSSLSKLRRVTFSDTPDSYLTQADLSYNIATQSTVSNSSQLDGNSMFKTMADFVTSAFQSLPGIISSFGKHTNSEVKFNVPKTAKRIRSPDTESSTGYSPSHKRRCYHCYLKENPIRKRRSISGCPTRFD